MSNFNDFYAFNSTKGGSGGGCSLRTVIILIGVVIFLSLLGQCFR